MSDLSPVGGAERVWDPVSPRPTPAPPPAPTRPGDRARDRIDISEVSRYLSQLQGVPSIRRDLVDRVRDEIARGVYETPDKLDEALRRAAQELTDDLDLLA